MTTERTIAGTKTGETHHEIWARSKSSGAVVEERVGGLRSTKSVCQQEICFQEETYPNPDRELFVVKVDTIYTAVT